VGFSYMAKDEATKIICNNYAKLWRAYIGRGRKNTPKIIVHLTGTVAYETTIKEPNGVVIRQSIH
jgi:hypothetical protein